MKLAFKSSAFSVFVLGLTLFISCQAPKSQPASRPAVIPFTLDMLATPPAQNKPDAELLNKMLKIETQFRTTNADANRWKQLGIKEPAYYQSLDTPTLALECFEKPLGFDLGKYSQPNVGFIELWVSHNGFAELITREDLLDGIIRVLDQSSSVVADPKSDLHQIVAAGNTADAICTLSRLAPLRQRIIGHEKEYVKALLNAAKRYRSRIDITDTPSAGFFGEPAWLVNLALEYVPLIDPENADAIAKPIKDFRFPKEQRLEDLKTFLDLAIPRLQEVSDRINPPKGA